MQQEALNSVACGSLNTLKQNKINADKIEFYTQYDVNLDCSFLAFEIILRDILIDAIHVCQSNKNAI